jgi:hypothetical protein
VVAPLAAALVRTHLRLNRSTAHHHHKDDGCVYKILLHRPTLLDTRCMINAATYAVAEVSGAFDVLLC